jgi:hypothetical protein
MNLRVVVVEQISENETKKVNGALESATATDIITQSDRRQKVKLILYLLNGRIDMIWGF